MSVEPEDVEWSIPSYAEANRAVWNDDMDGTDGVFAVVKCGGTEKSPFFMTDPKTKEPLYEKDEKGNYLLDDEGKKIPKIRYQTSWTWEVLWLDHPKGEEYIGQKFSQYYTPSMNVQSNMYAAMKALMGGSVDPAWKPSRAETEGRVCKATIRLGNPNDKGQRWPKLDGYRVDRSGMTYSGPTGEDVSGETPTPQENDVPF
jgi:hypothetical protein